MLLLLKGQNNFNLLYQKNTCLCQTAEQKNVKKRQNSEKKTHLTEISTKSLTNSIR